MAKASDLKLGKELGFAKFNYKITPMDKNWCGPHREAPKNLEFPLLMSTLAETSDFKFGAHAWVCQLGPS